MTQITMLASTITNYLNRFRLPVHFDFEAIPCFSCGKPIFAREKCERRGGKGGSGVPHYYHETCWEGKQI